MATSVASSDAATDGPVLTFINKRLRALRKKHNRIIQMEESVSQGKTLNKEQEETLRSKPHVVAAIDELEKLKQPLSVAVSEEINLALKSRGGLDGNPNATTTEEQQPSNCYSSSGGDNATETDIPSKENSEPDGRTERFAVVEDLLNLLYFGSMFDVKNQNDFTATMLTRTHERGCCLTYDYVPDDDASDLLGEKDLDLISMLGGLLMSRPVNSSLSHKNALQSCIQHARLWLSNSDQLIGQATDITYAGLREKLNKIMASDYFTATPEMRAPVEVAAAAGNYGSFQVPVHGSMLPVDIPGQMEGEAVQYQHTVQVTPVGQENGAHVIPSDTVNEFQQTEEVESSAELSTLNEPAAYQDEAGEREQEYRGQQYVPRRSSTYRGGRGMNGGGRRGYSNSRGGRGSGRGSGRHQYFEQGGNYYPRNSNYRGRGGRGYGGSHNYHGGGQAGGYSPADS